MISRSLQIASTYWLLGALCHIFPSADSKRVLLPCLSTLELHLDVEKGKQFSGVQLAAFSFILLALASCTVVSVPSSARADSDQAAEHCPIDSNVLECLTRLATKTLCDCTSTIMEKGVSLAYSSWLYGLSARLGTCHTAPKPDSENCSEACDVRSTTVVQSCPELAHLAFSFCQQARNDLSNHPSCYADLVRIY